MRAFFAGLLVAIAIAVGTAALSGMFGIAAAAYFSTPEVRLSS